MSESDDETKANETRRMWASLSFVLVLIIIGIPLWWKTTEVYRVSLPYERISALNDLSLRITTNVTIISSDHDVAKKILENIVQFFHDSDVLNVRASIKSMSDHLKVTLSALESEAEAVKVVKVDFHEAELPNNVLLVHRPKNNAPVWLGSQRVLFFKDDQASDEIVSALKSWLWQEEMLKGAKSARISDGSRSIRMRPSDSYDIALSVIHPAPDEMVVDFDAKSAMEDYIGSFVDELSFLHKFSLKSHWIHLLNLDFQSNLVPDASEFGRHYSVDMSTLPHLLTPLEKRISSAVTRNPTISLVLFANPCRTAPLHIYEKGIRSKGEVDAFMSPKWGGVFISNPSYEECRDHLKDPEVLAQHKPDTRLVMGTFLAQLRALLGITDTETLPGCQLELLSGVVPRTWELDSLIRIRTLEQIVSAKLTLQSISQLLGEISNIVINDAVGASIKSSVNDVEIATILLKSGNVLEAFKRSQSAYSAAEAAFSDPSLLALLYFPDDQKYAVYIPLFLPVMIPVIISLRNVVSWLRGKPLDKEKSD